MLKTTWEGVWGGELEGVEEGVGGVEKGVWRGRGVGVKG